MDKTLTVKIPVEWLLILATQGNMGSGEIPDIMQRWAKDQLIQSRYQQEYSDRQKEVMQETLQRLKNVIGDDETAKVMKAIASGVSIIDAGIEALINEP